MEYRAVIERIYEHLENDDLGKAVMACLRVARHTQDYLNTAVFLRELYPDRTQLTQWIKTKYDGWAYEEEVRVFATRTDGPP